MMSDIAYPGGPEITKGDYGASIPVRSGPRTEGDDRCQYAVGIWVADYMRQDRILDRLNAYEGDNIWTDVLYHVLTEDEYESAPDSMDRFAHDGIDYRYEPSRGEWVTTAIAAVPTMDGGAFDADWLLQPQGEARRLEAALRSFAERGFDGPQYTACATEVEGCPAYGLRIISQAGEWSPREWEVLGRVTVDGLYAGERVYEIGDGPRFRGGPSIWTRGRTGESIFQGGSRLRARLELPLLRHLTVIGVRAQLPGRLTRPDDGDWLPSGWQVMPDGTLNQFGDGGRLAAQWQYSDDEYGVGNVRREWAADPTEPEVHALRYIGYHVAGRLAGVEDPHGVYAQRQAEFEAELAAAQ